MEYTRTTAKLLEILGYTDLFPPQKQAIEAGIEKGRSVIVAAPTASGKTLIGLIAIVNRLQEEPEKRAVYTVPLRSIAMEKYREVKKLEILGFKVGVSIGDYSEGDIEGNLVVTTYEKLDSLLRNNPSLADTLAVLVVDEIHFVGDEDRGPVLESLIAKLLTVKNPPQIVGLSATVPNAREIAEWLGAELVISDWRPVPLREGVYWDGLIRFANGDTHEVAKIAGVASIDLSIDINKAGGQALVFVQARRRAVSLADKLARFSSRLYYDEAVAREAAIEISESEAPKVLREELSRLIKRGVAYHHAGLSSSQRRVIEDAFRRGGLAVISATPTLAAGVNLPARRVVVDDIYRFEEGLWKPLKVSEYKQLAGRAGRPRLDPYGEAVIVANSSEEVDELIEAYVRGDPESVASSLGGLKGLRHMILGLIASQQSIPYFEILRIVSKTLYAKSRPSRDIHSQVTTAISHLKAWGLIEDSGDSYSPTILGLEVSRHYLDPECIPVLRDLMSRFSGLSIEDFEVLFIISMMPDMTILPASRKETSRVIDRLLDERPETVSYIRWDSPREARAAKTALVLYDWINEVSEDSILEDHDVGPGDIMVLIDSAEWISSGLASIISVSVGDRSLSHKFTITAKRLRHGVKVELLPLVAIPRIGRVRARRLYEAGFKTLHDLLNAKPEDLLRIPGIGPATVEAIMDYLGLEKTLRGRGRGLESYLND